MKKRLTEYERLQRYYAKHARWTAKLAQWAREKAARREWRRNRPKIPFMRRPDRNYDVTLTQPSVLTARWDDGSIAYVETGTLPHRKASLTVNNPWRPTKPLGMTPTARSLNAVKWNCALNTAVGRASYQNLTHVRPEYTAMAEEHNRNYVSPAWGAHDEQLRTEAILKCLTNVKDQKWNAGVMIAEASGVATMVADAMQLVIRTRKLLHEGKFETAYYHFRKRSKYKSYPEWREQYWRQVRHIKSVRENAHIPKSWLYYHFGIVPTCRDISDAVDAFAAKKNDLPFQMGGVVRGYAKHTTRVITPRFRPGSLSGFYNGKMEYQAVRSVRVAIRVQPKNQMVARLSGLGATNLPEALWNRTPFSWVVDYFSTVGSWLSVLDTGLGWNFSEKWTESWRTIATSTFSPENGNGVKYLYPSGKSTISSKHLNRVVRGDLYGPMGSILPSVKRKGPSVQKISNLLSVLAGLFNSKAPRI